MTSEDEQLVQLTQEANSLQGQISKAATKDEALKLAFAAAELCLKALKVATSKEQKSAITAQCKSLLDGAEEIKHSKDWVLLQQPLQPQSRFQLNVNAPTSSRSSRPDLTSIPRPVTPVATPDDISGEVLADPFVHLSVGEQAKSSTSVSPDLTSSSEPPTAITTPDFTRSQIRPEDVRTLAEPANSRKLPKKELIILWRASKLNGVSYPPWEADPEGSDFSSSAGLYVDQSNLRLSPIQLEIFDGWRRSTEALPPPTWRGEGTVQQLNMQRGVATDLVQDAATDCSVVASLSAVAAREERGHSKMLTKRIFPSSTDDEGPELSPNGKYVVKINFNGCWRRVTIDDKLPVSKSDQNLHIVDRNNPGLLWPALLEKAYLKVRGGYDFPGSSSCTDLFAFTGWIPEQIYLQDPDTIPQSVWTRVFGSFGYGDVLITIGTGRMDHRTERKLGLEGQHSYAVLDMRESDNDKWLLVKNPWVDSKSHRRLSTTAFPAPPGAFWTSFDNVVKHFESLYLNWNPGLFLTRQDVHFEWNLSVSRDDSRCFVNHPQFSLKPTSTTEPIWLLLSRHFQNESKSTPDAALEETDIQEHDNEKRLSQDLPRGYISLYIYDNAGERVYLSEGHIERGQYVNTPQMMLKWTPPAVGAYTVVVAQMDLPAQSHSFTLSAFSNSPFAIADAVELHPVEYSVSGSWSGSTAIGVTMVPASYTEKPQYRFEIRKSTAVALLLQSQNPDLQVRVELLHGGGQRIFDGQQNHLIANSGSYRRGCALATFAELQPGIYTIVCSTFDGNQQGVFTLKAYTQVDCSLKPIPKAGAGLITLTLPPAIFPPGVSRIAVSLLPNVHSALWIVASFSRDIGVQRRGPSSVTHSPLLVTVEIGRGPNRDTRLASNDGQYSTTQTVRTTRVDLKPAMLQQGDVWLVVGRVAGPAAGIEEEYKVELFMEKPNALKFGAWRTWDD